MQSVAKKFLTGSASSPGAGSFGGPGGFGSGFGGSSGGGAFGGGGYGGGPGGQKGVPALNKLHGVLGQRAQVGVAVSLNTRVLMGWVNPG